MVPHRDRRTTKSVTRTPLRPTGYGGIGPSATLPLLDRWGDIDFVVASRICPNGARNAIPAGSCHGLLVVLPTGAASFRSLRGSVPVDNTASPGPGRPRGPSRCPTSTPPGGARRAYALQSRPFQEHTRAAPGVLMPVASRGSASRRASRGQCAEPTHRPTPDLDNFPPGAPRHRVVRHRHPVFATSTVARRAGSDRTLHSLWRRIRCHQRAALSESASQPPNCQRSATTTRIPGFWRPYAV